MTEPDIWPALIDKLKVQGEYLNYTDLACDLNVSKFKIYSARNGNGELSSEIKAEILLRLDEPLNQSIYESIFPEGSRVAVQKHISNNFHPENESKLQSRFWVRRLDELKALTEDPDDPKSTLRTDSAIASSLGITNAEISGIRNGTKSPSIPTKLKILDALGYMATRDVLLELLPRKAAMKLKKWDNLRFDRKSSRSNAKKT